MLISFLPLSLSVVARDDDEELLRHSKQESDPAPCFSFPILDRSVCALLIAFCLSSNACAHVLFNTPFSFSLVPLESSQPHSEIDLLMDKMGGEIAPEDDEETCNQRKKRRRRRILNNAFDFLAIITSTASESRMSTSIHTRPSSSSLSMRDFRINLHLYQAGSTRLLLR